MMVCSTILTVQHFLKVAEYYANSKKLESVFGWEGLQSVLIFSSLEG